MENHLAIDISNGSFLYQLFYVLSFLVAYAIIIYEGYRRNFPLLKWILLIALIRLLVVTGTKVFAFSPEDWRFMFQTGSFLPNPQKSMFGGILLGVTGYFLVRRILKFRYPVWDTVAVAFPIGVAIQTTGCFFYGCCYGTPSSMPWAVKYPVMSLAHFHQFESGFLTYSDNYSLPVHPVQLYESLGAILVVILVIRLKRYWKAQGSMFLSSVIIFAIQRLIVEFFRDPLSNKTGGEMLWIMKQVQWQYLAFAVIMTMVLIRREKKPKIYESSVKYNMPAMKTEIALLMFASIIFLLLHNWFTVTEIIAINIALLPALLFTGIELYKRNLTKRYRWIYVCSLIFPLFLMSQTLPQNQIDTKLNRNYKTFHTIGVGYATGNYTDNRMNYSGSGCDMISNHEYFSQKYNAGGAGYSFTKIDQDNNVIIRYGSNMMFGNYQQLRQSDNMIHKAFLWDVNPYIKYDTKWIGVGGGLHLGNLEFTSGDTRKKFTNNPPLPERGSFRTFVMPQVNLRVGVTRFFFGDFHLADQFPVSVPGLAFQAGIGSGFGLKNGLNMRAGFSFMDDAGFYVSGFFPLEDRIVIESLFQWTGKYEKEMYSIKLPEKQFSIGMSYRFGHK
jgi:phosphatidylglycerol:prolipoprotein diacylglycerol transferase